MVGYSVFGALFVGGIVAYWMVTRIFKDAEQTYGKKEP